MRYQISGKQIDIGAALQTHVQTELEEILSKYAGRPTEAYVVFSKSGHEYVCESVVHLSTGLNAQATGKANEIYAAFDASAEKMDKQLRRYKRRLNDRHEQSAHASREEEAAYRIFAPQEVDVEEAADAPLIVAETKVDIPESSVADAVMMLDLRDTNAMFFKNAGTGRHNMVYRRNDGSIGWVEPH